MILNPPSNILLLTTAAVFLAFPPNTSAASSLAIVQAGVQSAEDAPFVTTDYHFLPGDYLYVTFDVAGFAVKTAGEPPTRSIALSYEITPQDASGRPLTKPETGSIAVELAPEDKNWTPKRRASFVLPSALAAGEYQVHIFVKDAIAKSETEKTVPFRIGGTVVQPSDSITIEHFHCFRSETERQPLELPAYSPGDSVYMRFDLVGFKLGPDNQYHLAYGLKVLSPTGATYLNQPTAAEVASSSFYPAQFVPANLQVDTKPNALHGSYTVLLTIRDLIAHQTYTSQQTFTIE